jgi:surfeit locus 1 family protein
MQTKSLVGLTALMLAAFAVLTGLGVWQLQRLEWKQGLIAQIEARTNGPPITLEDAVALAGEGRDPSYYRVRADGRFHHAKERYLYAVSEGRVGWHVIAPFETEDGDVVLVDRGFVPDELKDPSARALLHLSSQRASSSQPVIPPEGGIHASLRASYGAA